MKRVAVPAHAFEVIDAARRIQPYDRVLWAMRLRGRFRLKKRETLSEHRPEVGRQQQEAD